MIAANPRHTAAAASPKRSGSASAKDAAAGGAGDAGAGGGTGVEGRGEVIGQGLWVMGEGRWGGKGGGAAEGRKYFVRFGGRRCFCFQHDR